MIITIAAYILYIYFVSDYVAKIFGKTNMSLKLLGLYLIINSIIVYLPIYFNSYYKEETFIIIYFIMFFIEVWYAFKLSVLSAIAVSLCFTINYFGTRILVIGLLSLNSGVQLIEFLSSQDNVIKITFLTFAILVPYIMISSRVLFHKSVKYLFIDTPSLILSCILLLAVLVNQWISFISLYAIVEDTNFNSIYQIRTGLVTLVSFVIIMVAVVLYSSLRQASIKYVDTEKEIKTDNITIHKLEKESITDYFTGFFVRSIAIDKLKSFLDNKEYCYVLFIDLDGLKNINDNYGHEQGDWYIKNAASHIKKVFNEDTISRIGGDEFLIIGNSKDTDIKTKVTVCSENILSLNKEYETSISYGFIEVDENNKLSCDELIDLADKEMYALKKSRNKQRKDRKI